MHFATSFRVLVSSNNFNVIKSRESSSDYGYRLLVRLYGLCCSFSSSSSSFSSSSYHHKYDTYLLS